MYLDANHLFIDQGELQDVTDGVVGEVIDVGAENRLGEMYPFYIFLACGSETTATGDPAIKFFLESADDKTFTTGVKRFQLFPDLTKADLNPNKGLLSNPCPFRALRYNRLYLEAASAITCAKFSAGLVIDAQTNFSRI